MQNMLTSVGINVLLAAAIALVAAGVTRLTRRPVLAHVLWLVVLVRLVMPPILPLPVIPELFNPGPRPDAQATRRLVMEGSPKDAVATAAPVASAGSGNWWSGFASDQLWPAASIVWALSTLLVMALGVWRILQFRKLLAASIAAPEELQHRANALAATIGVEKRPPILLAPGRVPPMLFSALSRPLILFPFELFDSLSPTEQDALIAHELAHFRRKDHWVRHFELVVAALFWWYPVTWWARRALHTAEEQCCDATVLRSLPGCARAYAESLCKAVEFLVEGGAVMPAAATGIGEARTLKRRLVMIMKSHTPKRLPAWVAGLGMAAALGCLMVFPSMAANTAAAAPEEKTKTSSNQPISIDLKNAELQEVLRLVAKQCDIDIANDAGVGGKVTLTLKDVSWQVALGEITKQNGLGYVINDGVVRIATKATLASELRNKLPIKKRKFVGEPVTLELNETNLDRVLNTFEQVTGRQIILQPNVSGTVTATLSDLPWDQALSAILRSNGLEYTIDDQVILVFRASDATAESETRAFAKKRNPTQ